MRTCSSSRRHGIAITTIRTPRSSPSPKSGSKRTGRPRRFPLGVSRSFTRRERQGPVPQSSEQLQDAKPQAVFSYPPPRVRAYPLAAVNRLRLGVCQLHWALISCLLVTHRRVTSFNGPHRKMVSSTSPHPTNRFHFQPCDLLVCAAARRAFVTAAGAEM